jgi:hypothetical protein
MQIPVSFGLKYDSNEGNPLDDRILSVESQLKLRRFYEYIDNSRAILSEVYEDFASMDLKKAAGRLEQLCIEADSWGFNSLYEVGLSLQMLFLNSSARMKDSSYMATLEHGLKMLSALLEQCETDFRWRLATADMLDDLNKAV